MDSANFASMKLAEADASGQYDVERLEKLSAAMAGTPGLVGALSKLSTGNLLGTGATLDAAFGRMGSAGEAHLTIRNNSVEINKWASEGGAPSSLFDDAPQKTARAAFDEKIASLLTGIPSAIASGLMASYGGGEFLPAAVGGYVAGDRGGISGGLAGVGSQYALNAAMGPHMGGPLGKLYNNVTNRNPLAVRGLSAASRLMAPIGASKLVDQLTGDD